MRELLIIATFCCIGAGHAQSFYINEFVARNTTGIVDEDGDHEDWLELYNAGVAPQSLYGYGLSDDINEPFKWACPDVEVGPGEFVIVFCSGKNRLWGPYLHTNFSIRRSGEDVLLTSPEGTVIDHIVPVALAIDHAFARTVDGTGYWERTDEPTPGFSNHSAEVLVFSHQSGHYAETIDLSVASVQGNAVRYTLDGSQPTATSLIFEETLAFGADNAPPSSIAHISTSMSWNDPSAEVMRVHTIRAQAYDDDVPVSRVYSKTYLVGAEVIERYGMYPIVSIQMDHGSLFNHDTGIYVPGAHFNVSNMDWTGNYFMRGIDWERDAHIEYFDEGQLKWAQDIGVRIHGGKTRSQPQKSLRLYARESKGAHKFHYKIFDTRAKTVFDKFILRAHFGCWNRTMIKDGLSGYTARDLDFDSQHSAPAIIFINGEFWGIQTFRDRLDANFFEEEYSVEKDSVDILLHGSGTHPNNGTDWGIVTGDNADYLALIDFIANNPLSEPENYAHVKTVLDVNSMIEFYCTSIYLNQYDWPSNNHKVWRARGSTKWRWMMYDFDSAWGYRPVGFNLLSYAAHPTGSSIYNTPYTTFLFRELLESEAFRQHFIHRYACLMNEEFTPEALEADIDHFKAMYDPAAVEQIDRWGNVASYSLWNLMIDSKLYDFAAFRRNHAIAHVASYFGIDFDPDDYDCDVQWGDSDDEEEEVLVEGYERTEPALHVYPNPSETLVWVDLEGCSQSAHIQVFDMTGSIVFNDRYRFHQQVDLSHLHAGMYLVIVHDGTIRRQARIIKK